MMTYTHTFHIPVLGIGFTIDTPLKVAHYGMDAVISLGDDGLLEQMRKMYCHQYDLAYEAIDARKTDHRAERITSYLNLIDTLARDKFEEMRSKAHEMGAEVRKYLDMLPSMTNHTDGTTPGTNDEGALAEQLSMGSIDVNIMTKVDKQNHHRGEPLPVEYNDAHAAVRGFAQSKLRSSLVLSAGMNPSLYSYIGRFDDFYPDREGRLKKKITLKVSDYRSALIQGKFLAKKGVWVSEYRVESGLNCGGHAFATEGTLMGPILAEFKENKETLVQTQRSLWEEALRNKGCTVPDGTLPVRITAQGGVGTAEEHRFLLQHYGVDSVGWGSPFLLVPEAVNVDEGTRNRLAEAQEEDLYLSNISPLGVPFHTLRGNTKELERQERVRTGRPGSPCPKQYLVTDRSFTDKPICTASRKYQRLKLKALEEQDLGKEAYQKAYDTIVEKSCLCGGLGTSALLVNGMDTSPSGDGVSVCPGPNMAYFSESMSLKAMTDQIYGKGPDITRADRPNMFIKELRLYLDHLESKFQELKANPDEKEQKRLEKFAGNLKAGIHYYRGLFNDASGFSAKTRKAALLALEECHGTLGGLLEKEGASLR